MGVTASQMKDTPNRHIKSHNTVHVRLCHLRLQHMGKGLREIESIFILYTRKQRAWDIYFQGQVTSVSTIPLFQLTCPASPFLPHRFLLILFRCTLLFSINL